MTPALRLKTARKLPGCRKLGWNGAKQSLSPPNNFLRALDSRRRCLGTFITSAYQRVILSLLLEHGVVSLIIYESFPCCDIRITAIHNALFLCAALSSDHVIGSKAKAVKIPSTIPLHLPPYNADWFHPSCPKRHSPLLPPLLRSLARPSRPPSSLPLPSPSNSQSLRPPPQVPQRQLQSELLPAAHQYPPQSPPSPLLASSNTASPD